MTNKLYFRPLNDYVVPVVGKLCLAPNYDSHIIHSERVHVARELGHTAKDAAVAKSIRLVRLQALLRMKALDS